MDDAYSDASLFEVVFGSLLGALRPKLHRYCARMTGSVIDGEDVLQEALLKAVDALPAAAPLANPEGWLFRIAHNAALDFLRRRARREGVEVSEEADMIAGPVSDVESRQATAASLRAFMGLSVRERSSVILMDVLGYSLSEIVAMTDMTLPTVKVLLHRGRAKLRDLAAQPEDNPPPVLTPQQRRQLAFYVERFNAHDFDAIRERLTEDARAELVGRTTMRGRKAVSTYFGNYASDDRWRLASGTVEGRPAVLVLAAATSQPIYFVLLTWMDDALAHIRDFRYARYAIENADIRLIE